MAKVNESVLRSKHVQNLCCAHAWEHIHSNSQTVSQVCLYCDAECKRNADNQIVEYYAGEM